MVDKFNQCSVIKFQMAWKVSLNIITSTKLPANNYQQRLDSLELNNCNLTLFDQTFNYFICLLKCNFFVEFLVIFPPRRTVLKWKSFEYVFTSSNDESPWTSSSVDIALCLRRKFNQMELENPLTTTSGTRWQRRQLSPRSPNERPLNTDGNK